MIKNLPRIMAPGYTIIEVIITLFIIIIVFSVAQANYRQFILKKSLDATKSQIVSDIRLAQEYALAGKKSATCLGLNGYIFSIGAASGALTYSIIADCSSDEIIKTIDLSKVAPGITLSYNGNTTIANGILFKILAGGTDISSLTSNVLFTLTQQTTGNTRTITVSPGGEVK